MSLIDNNQSEELRHERKFLISDRSFREVEQLLKYHPACFTEIYHQRQVNNIYFDSYGFDSYYSNVEGDTNRKKIRIRWYGDLIGEVNNPVLEFKIKNGLMGKKNSYKLSPFFMDKDFSYHRIICALDSSNVPGDIRDKVVSLKPALLNSYFRKYFISADKQFRITIDKELTFYGISYDRTNFLNKVTYHNAVVLELKYHSQLEHEAKEIGSLFPFAMTKNSKYLQGIESVLF